MTALSQELSGGDCCGNDCCFKIQTTGCAAGVPYAQLSLVTGSGKSISWLNLDTGDIVDTKPTGFVTGACADSGINLQTCYQIGADKYSVFKVNGVTTYFKNDVLVSGAANIDAAALAIAGATYTNIVSCEPEQVAPDNSTCYSKTVTTTIPAVPGTPGTPEADNVFTAQSSFPVRRILDGSGTLAEQVFGQEYRTDREEDGQYMLRDGSNNYSGSTGAYAIAFNFAIGVTTPQKFYSQKLFGTPGQTYKVGYWARERAANPAGNFRVDVLNGASVIATGTTGSIATSYTNYKSSSFVMPAAGFVTMELYNLVNGSGSGNDPLLDDIGLWTVTAAVPGTPGTPESTVTTTVTYRKVTLNNVDTYYDENNNVVTGAALTTLLADIAAGEYEVVPCASCGCGPEDIFPAGVDGQVWTVQPDGSFAWETPAAAVTCKGAHYQQLTLVAGVAQTITHTFGMTNPLAIGYSVRGVNGGTVGDWPTGVRFISHTANSVQVIADGIGGIVDVALFNTECLSEVMTDGTASGGGGGSTDCNCTIGDILTGGTDGQVLTVQPDGSYNWETPSGGGTASTEVADGTTITGVGTVADPFKVSNPVPGGGTAGQVLTKNPDGSYSWKTPTSSGGNSGTSGAGGQALSVNTVGMATQNVTTGTAYPGTDISLTNVVQNTFVNGSTWNGTTFTAGEAGNYMVTFEVRFGGSFAVTAGRVYQDYLLFNGVNVSTALELIEVSATVITLQIPQKVFLLSMAAGDTLKLQAASNDTGTATKPVYASRGTSLNIARLSGA